MTPVVELFDPLAQLLDLSFGAIILRLLILFRSVGSAHPTRRRGLGCCFKFLALGCKLLALSLELLAVSSRLLALEIVLRIALGHSG